MLYVRFVLYFSLRTYLSFSSVIPFYSPTIGEAFRGSVSISSSSLFYFNVLPPTPFHIHPSSLRGKPILSAICPPLGVLAPLCPWNTTSGQHQQWGLLCVPFTEASVTSTSRWCVRPCHTVTGTRRSLL